MTTHLRRHIEAAGLLYPEQLANALRRQEIYGGSLDTALLELELVDPATLTQWLTAACGLAPAPLALLVQRAGRPWDAVDVELMRLSWALPLSRQDGRLQIAVHPDLPDERLGGLYRHIPTMQPYVAPECCLEALRAEWLGSVVPQRYAVLSVAYRQAMRRAQDPLPPTVPEATTLQQPPRPARSHATVRYRWDAEQPGVLVPQDVGSGLPSVPEPPPSWATDSESLETVVDLPPDPDEDRAQSRDWPPSRETTAVGPAPTPTSPAGAWGRAPVRPPLPDAILSDGPGTDPLPLADHFPPAQRTEIIEVPFDHDPRPRARFTAQGTLIDDQAPAPFDEADLVRRMAGARGVLQTTRSRDAAIEAVVTAAMVIAKRVAVFRVRGSELVGLSTPRSQLDDVGGKVVPLDEGTPVADAVAATQFSGRLHDPDLALALALTEGPWCALRRIDVLGRPVLVLYLDNPNRPFYPAEIAALDALGADASDAFEAIVKLRRARQEGPAPRATRDDARDAEALGTGPHGTWGPPSPRLRAAYGDDDHVTLTRYDDDDDGVEVRAHHRHAVEERVPQFDPTQFVDDDGQTPEPEPEPEPPTRVTEELAPGLEVARVTDPAPPLPQHEPVELSLSRRTVHSAPPPPPLPPPPVRFAPYPSDPTLDSRRTEASTLPGVPPLAPEDDEPDEPDEMRIISLSSPIDQPSVRGHIELEDEDWAGPSDPADTSRAAQIEAEVQALAAGQGSIARLANLGDAGYAALAARLPGPLEVLRRDLRALPPPAAHGPLVRAAIAAGPMIVPHLLSLLHHPNPDVRFYAAYIFQELRDDRCAPALGALAFDVSGDVRVIAMRVLETYNRAEQFAASCAAVRTRLDSNDRTERLYAARALGTLRDVEAIHRLIDLLASGDRFIQEAAIESLCSITGQQLGLKPHRWKSWYLDNHDRHRIEWIIESLRHKDMPVRQWAAHELSRITGHRIAFSPVADKRGRESAVRAWIDWWQAEGKARLGVDRARL